ncbi:MFS transporter [Aquisphaera giovannonii]|uniref:MFS transporter n=1 Tax=Aquisphaera giovannonii TaxID=406548 RepID=UPI001FE6A11D|nr:MFS transporter [Aquisphaera giovannonii]
MQGEESGGASPGGPPAEGVRRGLAAPGAWAVLAVAAAVHLLDSSDRWLLPAVARPLCEELNLGDAQGGWLATLLLLSYAAWSPVAGYLADRIHRPRLLAVGIAVWGLAAVGTGLARSYDELQVARALVGAGGATAGVVSLTLIMDLFPAGRRGPALAAYYLGMPAGAAIGMGPGAALAGATAWQMAFLLVGAPGLALALAALLLPEPTRGRAEGIDEARLRRHEAAGPSREDYEDLMVNSSYTYSVFGLAFAMFAIGGLVYWLPAFLRAVHGLPDARVAGVIGLIVPAAAAAGIAAGGWAASREVPRPRLLFLVPGLAVLASLPLLALTALGRGERAVLVGAAGTVGLLFTTIVPCFAILASVVMPNMRGVAAAVAVAAAHLLGDIWSPGLMAWVAGEFGEPDAMATAFGRVLAAAGAVPVEAGPDAGPLNYAAALLAAAPAIAIAGVVLLSGARHLPRERALMLATLRAVPRRLHPLKPPTQK